PIRLRRLEPPRGWRHGLRDRQRTRQGNETADHRRRHRRHGRTGPRARRRRLPRPMAHRRPRGKNAGHRDDPAPGSRNGEAGLIGVAVLVSLATGPSPYGLGALPTNDPEHPMALVLTNHADGVRTTIYLTQDQITWLHGITRLEPRANPSSTTLP